MTNNFYHIRLYLPFWARKKLHYEETCLWPVPRSRPVIPGYMADHLEPGG